MPRSPVTPPAEGLAASARALRRGEVSARGLVESALAAIAAGQDGPAPLNAFATVDAAGARAAADRADAELAAGRDRGPLHGIPVGVKDMIDVAGLPTGAGTLHRRDAPPASRDATCVARLRTAGAIVVGKTATHEYAYGATGDRSATGPARNPRDRARMAGGSSSGSAVAVAAGMVAVALGTDTGGSVRVPAALCGVAGYKPAYGAIPTDGVLPLADSLDHVGVLASEPADCRLVASVLAGAPVASAGAPGAAAFAGAPGAAASAEAPAASVGTEPPVAWLGSSPGPAVDPDVASCARSALARAGVTVADAALPYAAEIREAFTAIQSGEVVAVHADRLDAAPDRFDPETLDRLRAAAHVRGWQYVRALADRERGRSHVAALLARHPVLAQPTVPIVAPLLQTRTIHHGVAEQSPVRAVLLAHTLPWNLLGLPALSVPAGAVAGLPVGLQLVCAPGHEARLFSLAAAVANAEVSRPAREAAPARR